MKKIQHFKPSLVTKTFFPEYDDISVINEGECFIWAYAAYLMFEGIELWYTNHHAFVKYRGRFYDSETLKGTPDWQDLPAVQRGWRPFINVSVEFFKSNWDHTERFNTTWSKIEYKARRAVSKY